MIYLVFWITMKLIAYTLLYCLLNLNGVVHSWINLMTDKVHRIRTRKKCVKLNALCILLQIRDQLNRLSSSGTTFLWSVSLTKWYSINPNHIGIYSPVKILEQWSQKVGFLKVEKTKVCPSNSISGFLWLPRRNRSGPEAKRQLN